jgi:hypothetical protein
MYVLDEIERAKDFEDDGVAFRSVEEVRLFYGSLLDSTDSSVFCFVECGDAFRTFAVFDEALGCYGEGIAKDSSCLEAYLKRGELLFQLAVSSGNDQDRVSFGLRSVDDFRKALVLSLGTNDVVWRLAVALLLVDDAMGVQALTKNVLMKGKSVSALTRCDFLYLSGLAKVFGGDNLGADEVFEQLVRLDCGVVSGWFGKLVACLALSGGAQAELMLVELKLRDAVLWEVGQRLQRSGCNRFVDVAKTFFEVENAFLRKAS